MLSILMNWVLFPDTSGVPSSNAASAFASSSNDGVESKVGAEIGRCHILAEPRPAKYSIDEERRRHRIGRAHPANLNERRPFAEPAAGAQTIPSRGAEADFALHKRVHRAVFEPE